MAPYDSPPSEAGPAAAPTLSAARAVALTLARILLIQLVLAVLVLGGSWICAARHIVAGIAAKQTGLIGLAGAALLLAATGTADCLLLAIARCWSLRRRGEGLVAQRQGWRRLSSHLDPVRWITGWPQIAVLLGGVASAIATLWLLRPHPQLVPALPAPSWLALGGASLALAFPLLVCERVVSATAAERFPEARSLAPILFLPVAVLIAGCALVAAEASSLVPANWVAVPTALFLLGVAAELAIRALAVPYAPVSGPTRTRAAASSLLCALLQPASLAPSALVGAISRGVGLDFTRSWAVAYVCAGLVPMMMLTLAFCWLLSGATQIGLNERGSYERFGAPTTMLGPGLHVLLPWPFGHVRRVDYGIVHAVAISYGDAEAPAAPDTVSADDAAPRGADRLWDRADPAEVSYVVAGLSGEQQSVQAISVSLRVLYRTGLDDARARLVLYSVDDPERIVRAFSGRILAHFFAESTLSVVLDQDRAGLARFLQSRLQQQLDGVRAGVDVVAVIVETIHPPSGAVSAYRGVQSAQVAASTSIAEERGHAVKVLAVAHRDAESTIAAAQAGSAEILSAARIELQNTLADDRAWHAGGEAFLLERYLGNLRVALTGAPLEIIDSRLTAGDLPILDVRPRPEPQAAGPAMGETAP